MNSIFTIYLKEIKEVLRDRRTVIFMLILPTVVIPLILNFTTKLMMKAEKKARTETLTYTVFGGDQLPGLVQFLQDSPDFKAGPEVEHENIAKAISDGKIKLAIEIPAQAESTINDGDQVVVKVYYNNASRTSKAFNRTKSLIDTYSDQLRSGKLETMGLASEDARNGLVHPIDIEGVGTADKREQIGEVAGGMLPYFFIIFAFIGALYPAIDLGAGEKERGTLETLLLTPVPRLQLVLGKFLVIYTTGITAALLSLGSITAWLLVQGPKVQGVLGDVISSISGIDLTLIGAMLIPTTAIFAALLMSISIYAKSFKEAQSYATPLNFLVILPAMVGMLPGIELDWKTAFIPITNISLAIKELIKGTMDYQLLVPILGSSILIAVAAVVFCSFWFNRESVLFRE